MNTYTSFYFAGAYSEALYQWSAAGISTTPFDTVSGSFPDIYCLGGTKSALENALALEIPAGVNGITWLDYSQTGSLDYNGYEKNLCKVNPQVIVAISDKGLNSNQTKNTFVHELGHALGWAGHSTDSTDVMYPYGSSIYNLTAHDRNHLVQIYELP